MVRLVTLAFLAFTLALPVMSVLAVEPDEILKDPVLESRARDISLELRCLVCQNQSIDDSNAPLAKDLRVLVRDHLTRGETNEEVIDFIVARYGEFVLLRPRFAPHTLLLWIAPPLLFLIGIFVIFRSYKRRSEEAGSRTAKRLSAKEKRELKKLLKET
jgi:cytochrome c-type biogenesis protein CcmH